VLAIGRDITQQRRLEAEHMHAQKMEAVGTLAAGIAHDFNNLLMGVIGMSDMALARLPETHAASRYIHELRKAANGGAAIVRQLMSFTRRDGVEPRDVVLDSAVESAATILHTLLGEDVELRLELEASGCHVMLAPGQLEQILMNLCTNARHAMPMGGRLVIRTSQQMIEHDDPRRAAGLLAGPHVELAVSDSGSGMPPETREKIFEPFFTTKEKGAGTGLGLSAVYGIVRQNSGHIEVESEVGAGSTFRILLPRIRPSQVGFRTPATPVLHGSGEKVLVVEDDELVRATIRHYLEERGYVVLDAANAMDALDLARRRGSEIRLVLSDTVLPGVQGLQAATQLAELMPRASVVFMSAHPKKLLVEEGRVPPDSVVLEKPFSEDDVVRAVHDALERGTPFRVIDARGSGSTVLLVEDYPVVRDAMRELLEEAGYHVLAATTVADALAKAERRRVDLLLTDARLPDGSGFGLSDQLRRRYPELPIVYVTGHADDEELAHAVARHQGTFLQKPVDLSELFRVVQTALA
jgi:CheY-like chemotaxis protein/nitrogen-specific signal transduction histidine kinase